MDGERTATVLVIEDDDATAKSIAQILTSNVDPQFCVQLAANRDEALSMTRRLAPELVISDLTLRRGPDSNASQGLLLCKELRSITNAPILIVAATARPGDKSLALNLGADDFLDKPFDEAELRSRSAALLRRSSRGSRTTPKGQQTTPSTQPLIVDLARHAVILGDRELLLTRTEIRFVFKLIERSGRIVTREELAIAAWADVSKAHGQSIDMHVQRLRKKLQNSPLSTVTLDTVRGAGYRIQVREGPEVVPSA